MLTWRTFTRVVLIAVLAPCPLLPAQESKAAPSEAELVELAQVLEASKGSRLDVELKTGKSYVRATLSKLTVDAKKAPKELRIQDPDSGRLISVGFSAIRSITLEREKVPEAPAGGSTSSARESKTEKEAKAAAAERQQWMERAQQRGVKPWLELSRDEHEQAVAKTRERIDEIQKAFVGVSLYETHEFLFLSNMPREQVVPYTTSLDKMYDMMCSMYRIKRGTPVWKGKCLVVAFVDKNDFQQFEARFYNGSPPENVMGLCHQSSTGEVVISCFRGNDPLYFGQLLVHETSHGFIHRYRTAARLPSWANEGMAEWIAMALVPYQGGVLRKQESATESMRSSHSMRGLLDAEPIDGLAMHYGMASSLTDFLIRADKIKYANFVDGMKEGKTWEESLKDSYGATREQLIANYGKAIGIADLRP